MRNVTLVRIHYTDHGTFGNLIIDDNGKRWLSGELPDRNNAHGKSCIPKGRYLCRWRHSPAHGMCYHVENVPGRSDVEMHPANIMGDRDLGFQSQLLGCVALGKGYATFGPGQVGHLTLTKPQKGVSGSKQAFDEFLTDLQHTEFTLRIISESENGGIC